MEMTETLTDDFNKKFKALYLKHYGIELTKDEANRKAIRLLNFYTAIINYHSRYADN